MMFRRNKKVELDLSIDVPAAASTLRDGLGLHHRWYFDLRLQEEVLRGARAGFAFAVAAWEPRTLHAGLNKDQLQQAATFTVGALRPYDIVTRVDDQRFRALLPGASGEAAATVVYRIRQELQLRFPGTGRWEAGIAIYPFDGEDADALLQLVTARLEEDSRPSRTA